MNILHVVPTFYPCLAAGGVVNAVYNLAKKQVENNNNVSVFTTDSCDNRLKFENENRYDVNVDGIKTYYFRNLSNKLKSSFLIDTPYSLPFKLRKEIKKYDIVHIHEHRHSLAILASHYANKNNIPYVLQAHGSVLPFFQKETLKNLFDKVWGFKILYCADRVLALTSVEEKQYLKMGIDSKKIKIVPLGVNLEEYSNLPKKGEFRQKCNINANDKLLLFLGRIHKIKGLDLLVESFSVLNNEINNDKPDDDDNSKHGDGKRENSENNIRLAIVGPDGGFLSEVKRLINEFDLNDKVIITGPLYNKDKKEALVDCDIFIMPSQYESFTTSGLEAMACRKPLILTKNNHIQNWVNEKVGFSCEYDKISLSNSVKKLLKNENLMKTFGENAEKLINEKYNWESVENQIQSIYKDIIKY